MSDQHLRNLSQVTQDTAVLHTLLQDAIDVELFTIPLYMTTLYSIKGLYANPANGQQLWPGMRPDLKSLEAPQLAYNAIFSVYIQEMLHLQLISNIATALGVKKPQFNIPSYPGDSIIPCIGDISSVPGFEDVKVELGPLNINQIKLFLAIELPDWDATHTSQTKPTVPFCTTDPMPNFGTIGHLYECIEEYLDLKYIDGKTLFDKVFASNSVQVDLFDYHQGGHKSEYLGFRTRLSRSYETISKQENRERISEMITAIVDQGEGASSTNSGVPNKYTPSETNIADNQNKSDAVVRSFWDKFSHYDRFVYIQDLFNQNSIMTWPQWFENNGSTPWTAELLLSTPSTATAKDKSMAASRADAMNDPSTSSDLNNALNQSFANLLTSMENAWTNPKWNQVGNPASENAPKVNNLFPYAAMQALYTRVATIWATNGTPEFAKVSSKDIPVGQGNACQGMDISNPGENNCANATPHTCAGANSCQFQGGCGYPDEFWPGDNSGKHDGGCGAPIPDSQVLHNLPNPVPSSPSLANVPTEGDSVYNTAWEVFLTKLPSGKTPTKPTPNNIRLVLPPS